MLYNTHSKLDTPDEEFLNEVLTSNDNHKNEVLTVLLSHTQ